jgi:biopolymer transport protein ExbD
LGAEWDLEDEIVAEINITPLVDIFLVLLIIFMVGTSVMSQMGMDVTLPKSSQAVSSSKPEGVVVTLMKQGGIKVNGVMLLGSPPVTDAGWSKFQDAIKVALEKSTSRLVILEGDEQAFLGSAVQIMDQARKAGADRFAIATQPESK